MQINKLAEGMVLGQIKAGGRAAAERCRDAEALCTVAAAGASPEAATAALAAATAAMEAELAVVKRRFGAARRSAEADAGGEDFLDTHAFAREWWGAHRADGEAAAAESEQAWLATQPAGEVGVRADAQAAVRAVADDLRQRAAAMVEQAAPEPALLTLGCP